jgi:hypothetical protein
MSVVPSLSEKKIKNHEVHKLSKQQKQEAQSLIFKNQNRSDLQVMAS